jgi:hypothetical protein
LNSFIIKFILEKLKIILVVGAIFALVIYIIFGSKMFLNFGIGLLVGCGNFILLSIGTDLIISARAITVRIIHFLFFTFRYVLIAYIIIQQIKLNNANVFAMTGGLLTTNLALVLHAFTKHFLSRKEG